ncbi:Hypothetical predicted protein [Cloeon dipterum]|uniref:Uncharacterized protein n=1 Tax=Cloeon dipterum TaxID=197152 RepID=A0A8S1DQF4_9INSE|nr:Hypothetical predicted protein [Cloeon dipterum]
MRLHKMMKQDTRSTILHPASTHNRLAFTRASLTLMQLVHFRVCLHQCRFSSTRATSSSTIIPPAKKEKLFIIEGVWNGDLGSVYPTFDEVVQGKKEKISAPIFINKLVNFLADLVANALQLFRLLS